MDIDHFDTRTGANLYALLFSSTGTAFNPTTSTFNSFSDAGIDNFDIPLTEVGIRAGYYTATVINVSGVLTSDIYTVEIRNRAGATPVKSTDFLKSISQIYWNGVGELFSLSVPEIRGPSFLGSMFASGTVNIRIGTYDKFGLQSDLDAAPEYFIYGTAPSPIASGLFNSFDTGAYFASISTTGSVGATNTSYTIRIVGDKDGSQLVTNHHFSVAPAPLFGFDLLSSLGYTSGFVLTSSSTSGFTASVGATINDVYNGSIVRFMNGDASGQARIVYDFTVIAGPVKTFALNKPIVGAGTLSSGDYFVIFPIGGELGVV